jgi:hypothetical protein
VPYIDRSTASLRFIGEGLDPNELPKRLEFFPSEEAANPIVKTKREKLIVWSVSFPESDSRELEQKIEILLSWFTNDINVWKEVSGKYRGEVFCGLFLDGWNRGFELSTELLKKLSDRNLLIGFDIYLPTDT